MLRRNTIPASDFALLVQKPVHKPRTPVGGAKDCSLITTRQHTSKTVHVWTTQMMLRDHVCVFERVLEKHRYSRLLLWVLFVDALTQRVVFSALVFFCI